MPGWLRSSDRRTARRLAALFGVFLILSGLMPVVAAPIAFGADTAFLAPDNTASPNGEWSNPANATDGTDDGVYATATGDDRDQGFRDFSFAIPHGSIIDGITVKANAFSSDSSGCQLAARLSWNDGSSFTGRKTLNLGNSSSAVLTFGSATDDWGHTWDPTQTTNGSFRLEIRNEDPGSSCSGTTSLDWVTASVTYRTINAGTANPALSSEVCEAADFNFVIDMSGSIGPQGSNPSNLPDLKAGITGFVNAFQGAGGDGRYSGTRFNGTSANTLTSGYVGASTFTNAVGALTTPDGTTPTAAGINAAAANNANDRAGVPNVMFVVTDGSPNVPGGDLDEPPTWLQAANAAVAAADAARAGSGASKYIVKAVYLSTAGDPGDTSLPFSSAGDSQWATEVMDRIGGGSHFDADFSGFVKDLFEAIDCAPPSTTIHKVADDGSVDAGDQIGFTITVDNGGGSPAHDVVVNDNLPDSAGTDWSISPAVAGCSISGAPGNQSLHCDFGTIAAGGQKSVHVVSGTGKACGVYDNTAAFSSSDGGSGEASDSVNVRCPSIDVEKVADDPSVSAGDQIGFVITVTSGGPGAATGVTLTDTLPTDAGTSWSIAGGSGAAKCDIAGGVLTCDFGRMEKDDVYTVHLVSPTSKATLADSPVRNTAVVTTTNDGSDEDTDEVDVLGPDLEVVKVGNGPLSAGSTATFTLTVVNHGPGVAYGVTLSDQLPAGAWSLGGPNAAACSISGANLLTCDFGTLAALASRTVTVSRATAPADCGSIANAATVEATNEDTDADQYPNTDDASIGVSCPDLTVVKTGNGPISAGENAQFTIVVTNLGPGSAFGVTLEDELPAGIDWVVGGPDGASCDVADGFLSCDFGTLAAQASRTVTLTGETDKDDCGVVDNTAVVAATNEPVANQDDNSSQASVPVSCPEMLITKTPDAPEVSAGDQIGFTVEITNNGGGSVFGLKVDDVLPAGFAWVIESQTGGWTIADGKLAWGPATLVAHASTSVHIVAATTPAACGKVVNTASFVTSNDGSGSDDAEVTIECPNVSVAKTADNSPILAGHQAAFTITVTNEGPGVARDVTLSDELAAGHDWVQDSEDCSIVDGVLTCEFGDLDADESRVVHLSAATSVEDCGQLPNTAVVAAANEPRGATEDNEDGAVVVVQCAAIDIVKTAGEAADGAELVAQAGDVLYTYLVTNTGTAALAGVAVVDDHGTPDDPSDDIVVECPGTTLAAGASMTCTALIPVGEGVTTNVATVTAHPAADEQGSVSAEDDAVVRVPTLTIDKSVDLSGDPIVEGSVVDFTLAYDLTDGPVTAGIITDVLPEGLTYVDGSATDSDEFVFVGYDAASRTLTWTAANLTKDGSVSYQVLVEQGAVDLVQPLRNVAVIDSAETNPDDDDATVPVGEVLEETGTPDVTPPSTDVAGQAGRSTAGSDLWVILLAIGGIMFLTLAVTPRRAPARARQDRQG